MQFALLPGWVEAFAIAFARIGVLVVLLPGIGERALPMRFRAGLAFILTLVALPTVREASAAASGGPVERLIGEMLIGLALGLAARVTLASLDVAANLIAQSIGLSFAQVLDPTQGQQAEMLTGFFRLLGVMLILTGDWHHVALAGIFDSYTALPPGLAAPAGDAAQLMLMLVSEVFHAGVRIAAPFLVFGLVFNLGLGLASRMAPQIQLFFLTMPAGLLLGAAALALVLEPAGRQFLALHGAVLGQIFGTGR